MLTHYIRRKKKPGFSNKLNNALESIIVNAMPMDRLLTVDQAYTEAARCLKQEEITVPKRETFGPLLEDLAQRGFLVELHGARLQRFIDSVN